MSITLDGTTGIITPATTATTITSPAATALTIQSAGVTAVTVDTAQNVGIGTSSPASRISSAGSSITDFKALTLRNYNGTTGSAAVLNFEASIGTEGDITSSVAQIKGIRTGAGTSGALAFWTSNSGVSAEKVRINASGYVGMGASTTIAAKLTVEGLGQASAPTVTGSKAATIYAVAVDNISDYGGGIEFGGQSNKTFAAWKGGITNGTSNSIGYLAAYVRLSVTDAGMTEAMRIDAGGNLLVGRTTSNAGAARLAVDQGSGVYAMAVSGGGLTGAQVWYTWINGTSYYILNNLNQGVYLAYGGTSWTANSDERLKTVLIPFENAAAKVATLRAGTGRYLNDAEDVSRSFLIAQDVQKVLPEAVDVQADEQGTLGLRYTDLIPLLTAAIQEQQAMLTQQAAAIDALTARVAALEPKV